MKKLSTTLFLIILFIFIGCVPGSKENSEREKAKNDSLNTAKKDKIIEDSIAQIEQAKQDSIIKATAIEDSLAKLKTKNNNKKPPVKKPSSKTINKKNIKQTNKKALPKKK